MPTAQRGQDTMSNRDFTRNTSSYPQRGQRIYWRIGYTLPDPIASYEDWERFTMADVPYMSAAQRWAERMAASEALTHLITNGRDPCIVSPSLERIAATTWLRWRIAATREPVR